MGALRHPNYITPIFDKESHQQPNNHNENPLA